MVSFWTHKGNNSSIYFLENSIQIAILFFSTNLLLGHTKGVFLSELVSNNSSHMYIHNVHTYMVIKRASAGYISTFKKRGLASNSEIFVRFKKKESIIHWESSQPK